MKKSFFKVSNFDQCQHYKDRNPPWIRLYNNLLEDYEFGQLSDQGKAHLLLIFLLASRMGNKLPLDEKWIGSKIQANSKVNLDELMSFGFIEEIIEENQNDTATPLHLEQNASNTLADCSQVARPEQRRAEQRRAEQRRAEQRRAEQRRAEQSRFGPRPSAIKKLDEDFLQGLKANPAYKHIDLEIELAKMDAWLQTPRGKKRQKTRAFILSWLNRIDRPVAPGLSGGHVDPWLAEQLAKEQQSSGQKEVRPHERH